MKRSFILLVTFFFAFLWVTSGVAEKKEAKESLDSCPGGNRAVTTPAPVNIAHVLEAISSLKTKDGKPALELSAELVKDVHDVFNLDLVKTKMEQFYTLLYVLNEHIVTPQEKEIHLDASSVREILLRSKVFTDPEIPKHIDAVWIYRREKLRPRYTVVFDQDQTVIPLNKGEGFYLFRNGMCQHAKKLIFRKQFSVNLKKNRKGNTVARYFKGVDLFGTFGNRGIVDVDINYVELRSVEFYRGTPDGKVMAYVSPEEFKKNKHSVILRVITRLVPDRSVQPIDW